MHSSSLSDPSSCVSRIRLDSEHGEIRTGTQADFQFRTLPVRSKRGNVRPTLECWRTLNLKSQQLLTDPFCQARQLMSLIGLSTDTEMQIHLGRLHMRPIQWHQKYHWRIQESVENVIPIP